MPTLWMFVDTAEGFIEIAQKKPVWEAYYDCGWGKLVSMF